MNPIDREIAWMAVGQELVDANNVQRVLFHYSRSGRQGKLADYFVENNLILPHDAVQMTKVARERAGERRKRLEVALREFAKLGSIEALIPEYPKEPEPQQVKRVASGVHDVAAFREGQVVQSPVDPRLQETRKLPRKKSRKIKKRILHKPTEVIIENSPPAAPQPAPQPEPQASEAEQAVAKPEVDETVFLEADIAANISAPAAGEAQRSLKLPYFTAGFAAGVLLCSVLFFLGGLQRKMFGKSSGEKSENAVPAQSQPAATVAEK